MEGVFKINFDGALLKCWCDCLQSGGNCNSNSLPGFWVFMMFRLKGIPLTMMFALLKVLLSTLYQLWGNVLCFILRPFSSLIIHNQRTSGGKMSQVILKPYAL